MALTDAKLDELEALAGVPNRMRNDQGEAQVDLLQQVRALKEIASLRAAAVGPGGRKRLFSSMANKLKPPGVSS